MRLEISIDISRRTVVAGLAGLLLLGAVGKLASESFTLTTTYPSPSGVYTQIITTGNGSAGALDTVLARNAGSVVVGGAGPASAKLTVLGTISVADGSQGDGKVLTSDASGRASWQYCTYAP